EAQGQGVRARGEPRRGASGSRGAGRGVGRAHRLRDSGAPSRGGRAGPRRAGARGVSVPATAALAARDQLTLALDRAAGARPIEGNRLEHHPDSPRALDAMLAAIVAARHWVHFENYIIRDDATGRRFADALAERARAGVRVRVLYDALGSFGTSRRYWRRLTQAGAEVRAFHPLLTRHALDLLARDHRKLLVADGVWAMTGGLCIGDEWAGDPARGRRPWRDTMVAVTGPAAAALDGAFARIWRQTGGALPPDELDADPVSCGDSTVRVVEGVPGRARVDRAGELLRPSAKGSPKSSRASSGTTSRRARRSCCSRAACGCPHGSRPGALPTKVMCRTSARATSSAPSRWWRCGGLRADCGAPLRRPPRSDAPSWAACCSSSPVSWGSSSPPGRSRWPSRSACTHWNGAARGTRTMADPQPPWEPARIAQQDEADLVARAVAGERAAFGMLVERYAGVARRVARAVLGNPEDADDA